MWNQKIYAIKEGWGTYVRPEKRVYIGNTGQIGKDQLVVSSEIDEGTGQNHYVAIDIDLPAKLVESSTPGHYHLFIKKELTWSRYRELLKALAVAGIIEEGYYRAALENRGTSLRLNPTKHDETDW